MSERAVQMSLTEGRVANGYAYVPLDQLIKAEWNYKEDNEKYMTQLKKSIEENGCVQNLIVREVKDSKGKLKLEVVNGNHRLVALQELGHTEAPVCNLGEVDLATAKKVALQTNEIRFNNDSSKLDSLLTELLQTNSSEYLSDILPYDMLDLDMLEGSDLSYDSSDLEDSLISENHTDLSYFTTANSETQTASKKYTLTLYTFDEGLYNDTVASLDRETARTRKFKLEDFIAKINATYAHYQSANEDLGDSNLDVLN